MERNLEMNEINEINEINKLIAKEAVDMCIKLKETYTRFNETMALVPDLLMEQWRWNSDCFYHDILECDERFEALEEGPSEDGLSNEVYFEEAEDAVNFIQKIIEHVEDKLEEFIDIALDSKAEFLITDRLDKNLKCNKCSNTLASYRYRVNMILCSECYWSEVYDG